MQNRVDFVGGALAAPCCEASSQPTPETKRTAGARRSAADEVLQLRPLCALDSAVSANLAAGVAGGLISRLALRDWTKTALANWVMPGFLSLERKLTAGVSCGPAIFSGWRWWQHLRTPLVSKRNKFNLS